MLSGQGFSIGECLHFGSRFSRCDLSSLCNLTVLDPRFDRFQFGLVFGGNGFSISNRFIHGCGFDLSVLFCLCDLPCLCSLCLRILQSIAALTCQAKNSGLSA